MTTIGSGQALRVEVTSNVVRVLVGGAEVITYTDPSPITAGSGRPGILVGLFSSSMVSVSPEIWDDWDGGRLP